MPSNNVYGTLYNADSGALSNGMLLRISANKRVVRALADSDAHVQGFVGVNGSGIVGIGGPLTVVSEAVQQPVLCETGLTLAAGDTLFISETVAGRATNVAPAIAVAIGTVADVGSYASDARVIAAVATQGSTSGGGSGSGALAARAVATSNITLSGAQTVDGVALVADDLALAVGQTDASENGYYVVGTPWTRATTFDTTEEMTAGKLFSVTEGTIFADTLWMFATTGVVDPGVTNLSFLVIGPSFGPDTRIQLPNSNNALVNALRLVAALTTATAGAENSNWIMSVLHNGIAREMLRLEHNYIGINDTGIWFQSNPTTGYLLNGPGRVEYYSNGTAVFVITPTAVVVAGNGGDIQIGTAAPLSTNAVAGFIDVPSMAGTPIGTPTPASGKIPLVVDTSGNKLWGYYAGAWHDLTGA